MIGYNEIPIILKLGLRAKLFKKINDVTKEIGVLQSDGTNERQGYPFVSNNKIEIEVNKILPKIGLVINSDILGIQTETGANAKGLKYWRSTAKMRFELGDCETGFSMYYEFTGCDTDYNGKDVQQAITEATKRFYIKTFHIAMKEEDDPDSKDIVVNETIDNEYQNIIENLKFAGYTKDNIQKLFEAKQAEDISNMIEGLRDQGHDGNQVKWFLNYSQCDIRKIDILKTLALKYGNDKLPKLVDVINKTGWDMDAIEDYYNNPPK